MPGFLSDHREDYQIIGPHDFVAHGSCLEFEDEFFAFNFLAELADRTFTRTALRRMAEEDGLVLDPWGISDAKLLRHLAAHLIDGRLRVVRRDALGRIATSGGRTPGTTGERTDEEDDEAAPPPESDELTWIKFEVLYDETGDPVKRVTLKVKLPDGTFQNVTTDPSGIAGIENIQPGTCDIERMVDSDTLEVVAVL